MDNKVPCFYLIICSKTCIMHDFGVYKQNTSYSFWGPMYPRLPPS